MTSCWKKKSNQLVKEKSKSKKKEFEQSIETLKNDRSELIKRLERLGGGKQYDDQSDDDDENDY